MSIHVHVHVRVHSPMYTFSRTCIPVSYLYLDIGNKLLDIGNKLLDSLNDYKFENDEFFAIWNDWRGRDSRAHIERTFDNGRWRHEKRTLGIVTGIWYCCLKTEAARAKGLQLDMK